MSGMLVLRRYKGESIFIDEGIEIKIVRAAGQVAVGIDAPRDLAVWRGEHSADQTQVKSTAAPPLPPTLRDENRRLSLLGELQAGTIRSLIDEVTRLSGELLDRNEDCDRYSKRIFALDIDVGNLKDWLGEAEAERDQLQTRLDDIEDPPIKEPQRREDTGSGRGLELGITPRAWGMEVGHE